MTPGDLRHCTPAEAQVLRTFHLARLQARESEPPQEEMYPV